jgi:hypothetical protein
VLLCTCVWWRGGQGSVWEVNWGGWNVRVGGVICYVSRGLKFEAALAR